MRKSLLRALPAVKDALKDFTKDGCATLAASISYFSLMSLVPILFVAIALFGSLLGSSQAFYNHTIRFLLTMIPSLDETLLEDLSSVIQFRKIGVVGLLVFIWLGGQVFFHLEFAVNTVFKTQKRRHFIVTTVLSMALVAMAWCFFLASFVSTGISHLIRNSKIVLINIDLSHWLGHSWLLGYVIPFLLVWIAITALYILLPYGRVERLSALCAAFITTVMWETAKHLFTWYVGQVVDLGKVYGSLAAIVVFLIWVYYSAAIFLFGAEWLYHVGGIRSSPSGIRKGK
jgi:membrane protein